MKEYQNIDDANSARVHQSETEDNLNKQQSNQERLTSGMTSDNKTKQTEASESLQQILEKVKEELSIANDKYVRLYAEFENFRKRTSQEKLALIETASEKILQQILPVIDDFERALASLQQDNISVEAAEEGVKLIHDKMLHILEQAGVQVMQLEKGSPFDAELQEAITKIPVTEAALHGKIVDVIEKGYLLKNKVLRHAKVIIGE
jgi:molecular chaperone GrpE